MKMVPRPSTSFSRRDDILANARRQTWVKVGSEKDQRLQDYLAANITERDGRFSLSWEPGVIGVVTWSPR